MTLARLVLANMRFHRRTITLTVASVALLLFLALSAVVFTTTIRQLADAPLRALHTEIILQKDTANKNPANIRTSGVIMPFTLTAFPRDTTLRTLSAIPNVSGLSTALVLWQFDAANNRTIVGISVNDKPIGLRKIAQWLMPGSTFFSADNAQEVILERHFAKLFGYTRGGTYTVGDHHYTIVGIVDFKEQSNLANAQVFMPYTTALALSGARTPVVNQVYIAVHNAALLTRTRGAITRAFPTFSLLTKDRLLKNVSSFHRIIYRFGTLFAIAASVLAGAMIAWILTLHRAALHTHTAILHAIGWPRALIVTWIVLELTIITATAAIIALALTTIVSRGILPHITLTATPLISFMR